MTAAKDAWPHTNIFVGTNGLVGEIQGIIEHAYQKKWGVGDGCVGHKERREGDRIIQGIVGGFDYRGKTPIGYAVESPTWGSNGAARRGACQESYTTMQ